MLDSPMYLEEYALERSRSLSRQLAQCRLAEEYGQRSPPRWRGFLARRLASLSLRLDDKAALAALEAGLFLR